MKKAIACIALAIGLYLWKHQQAEPQTTSRVTVVQPKATAATVVVAAQKGGLDGNGGWEFKSAFKDDAPITDLKGGASWK